jgi:hypothetical protein
MEAKEKRRVESTNCTLQVEVERMYWREAKPDLTETETLKYPILRQGAVNIPASGAGAVE